MISCQAEMPTRSASVPGRRHARAAPSPRASEAGAPAKDRPRLTVRARVGRWRARRTTERVDRCGTRRSDGAAASGAGIGGGRYRAASDADCIGQRRDQAANAARRSDRSHRRGPAARRAEARGTVTRMGRDRASGLGSAKPSRARPEGTRLPRSPASTTWSAHVRHSGWAAKTTTGVADFHDRPPGDRSPRGRERMIAFAASRGARPAQAGRPAGP